MRKTSLALVLSLFVALAAVVSTARAVNTTGTNLSLYLALPGSCSGKNPDVHAKLITWPANSAFFVRHGWAGGASLTEQERAGFMGPNTNFELYVDGVEQTSILDLTISGDGSIIKFFVTNFPDGMTGTHQLRGWWFIDGGLVGGTFGTEVFAEACALDVSFQ